MTRAALEVEKLDLHRTHLPRQAPRRRSMTPTARARASTSTPAPANFARASPPRTRREREQPRNRRPRAIRRRGRRATSSPLAPVDGPAGGNVLGVVTQQLLAQLEEARDPLVGQAVVDGPVLAAAIDEAAPAQAGEVVRDLRLRRSERFHELPTERSRSSSNWRIRTRVGSPRPRKYLARRSVSAGASGRRKGVRNWAMLISSVYYIR